MAGDRPERAGGLERCASVFPALGGGILTSKGRTRSERADPHTKRSVTTGALGTFVPQPLRNARAPRLSLIEGFNGRLDRGWVLCTMDNLHGPVRVSEGDGIS